MNESMAAMQTALRVLTAINSHCKPKAEDVEELCRYAPLLKDAPLDDLACDVIQQALKRRALRREKARGSGA
jgi:hypothetical protein